MVPPALSPERVALDNRMRVWSLGVRFAIADVISLGRPFEVCYSTATPRAPDQSLLSHLGVGLLQLFGSHVIRVKDTWGPNTRVSAHVTSLHGAPTGTPLDSVRANDFLVAMNGEDLLSLPLHSLSHLQKRLTSGYSTALAARRPGESITITTLRFVRLDTSVLVDPTRRLTHGRVLQIVDSTEATLRNLQRQYEELIRVNRPMVTSRLSRHAKVLQYTQHLLLQIQYAVREDHSFQFARQFRSWFAGQMATFDATADDDDPGLSDDNEDEDHAVEPEPPIYEIESDESMHEEGEESKEGEEEGETTAARPQVTPQHSATAPAPATTATTSGQAEQRVAGPRQSVYDKIRSLGGTAPNLQWRDVLFAHEMKWLPSATIVLSNFIEGTVEGFVADGIWNMSIPERVRSIAEYLVKMYAKKLETSSKNNAAIKREFMVHIRMLRSNLCNPKNCQLRADVLVGQVSVETLCSMTSEELAPESLRAERQRMYERHVKEVTITAPPSGPRLVKTKNGIREVEYDDGAIRASSVLAPTDCVAERDVSGSATVGGGEEDTRKRANSGATDEVVQRLEAMNVGQGTRAPPSKPSTANLPQQQVPPPPQQTSDQMPSARQTPQPVAPFRVDAVGFNVGDTAKFLRALFDPAHDVEGTIHQLQKAVLTASSLATFSNEFMLTTGVMLHRDATYLPTRDGGFCFRARVKLLHWKFEESAPSDRNATLGALERLVTELKECRRRFGDLLHELQTHPRCCFPQPLRNRAAYLEAINLSVRYGLKTHVVPFKTRDGADWFRATAVLDRMELASAVDRAQPVASERALQEAVALMSELVAIMCREPPVSNQTEQTPDNYSAPIPVPAAPEQSSRYEALAPQPTHDMQPQNQARSGYGEPPRPSYDARAQDQYRRNEAEQPRPRDEAHVQAQFRRYDAEPHRSRDDPRALDSADARKRTLDEGDHQSGVSHEYEPPHAKRKVDSPSTAPPPHDRQRSTPDQPMFFVDAKGESKSKMPPPISKERMEKNQVEAYQELVRALFRHFDDVKARVKTLESDLNLPEKRIEFSSRLNVIRKITRTRDQYTYLCEVTGLDGNLVIRNESSPLNVAVENVMRLVQKWLEDVRKDWSELVNVFMDIKRRKAKQKGKQADDSLSAANETRKDRNVADFVKDYERPVGAMAEFKIEVRRLLVIRQVCLNAKMAKRAAGEEFRNLLDWIIRQSPANNPPRGDPGSSASSSSGSRPTPKRDTSRPRPPSNMIVCSDDSGDDDDDDDDYAGGYSDDDDWHPQAAKAADPSSSRASVSSAQAVQAVLSAPYPIESEADGSDAGRMRAIIRSLFTPEDNLCSGISRVRRALQYHGSYSTSIVPNVRASIRLVKEGYDVFDIYVSLNDVLTFTAYARSKEEACNKAVDGLLDVLDSTRRVWVQLLHFFHVKEMGNFNVLDSFNALRLANIAKIETKIEPAPGSAAHTLVSRSDDKSSSPRAHCVMYVAGKQVYRVDCDSEVEAHALATAKTTRFLVDLIDSGLDKDNDERDTDFVPMQRVDWHCSMQLQDFGDQSKRVEFIADACWAIPGRVPVDFVLPSRTSLVQVGRTDLFQFERDFNAARGLDCCYFKVEATYENGKFVNRIAAYGNKNRSRVFVLEFEVVENADVEVFIFPPGASVNSDRNLYVPRRVIPQKLCDRKAVYGVVRLRRPTSR